MVPKTVREIPKVRGLESALKVADQLHADSKSFHLNEDESHYVNDHSNKKFARVTTVINEHRDDSFPEAWQVPSTNIGTSVHGLIEDYLTGVLLQDDEGNWHHDSNGDDIEVIYPNMDKEAILEFLEQLKTLKKQFDEKGLVLAGSELTVDGSIKIKKDNGVVDLPTAGSVDLLMHD